ncbi:MAG: c-type cytochrome [Novosphingobium sp.]|nr:c-type cytochrome [Novosphingobium sp.]
MIHALGAFAALVIGFSSLAAVAETARVPSPAQTGRKLFIRCAACHSTSADARPLVGPHLAGLVGRKVASVEGFAYSQRLPAQQFAWDETRLDRWLTAPQADFPGMCLPFTGLARPEDRAALIAYLKNPAP